MHPASVICYLSEQLVSQKPTLAPFQKDPLQPAVCVNAHYHSGEILGPWTGTPVLVYHKTMPAAGTGR